MHSPWIPRALLILAPAIFMLQSRVWVSRGEPYPALIMPMFGPASSPAPPRPVALLMRGDGVLAEVTFDELFPDWPRTNRITLPGSYCRHEPTAIARAWLLARARRLEPQADDVVIRWE